MTSYFVDVHTHLTHQRFADDQSLVIERSEQAGLGAVVVNGLEPQSNRQILTMAKRWGIIKPALGIYPVDAVNDQLPEDLPFTTKSFDVASELAFIRQAADAGEIIAVGECGLDGHWLPPSTYAAQEQVFENLIESALRNDLPIIIHTRKLEVRAAEILRHHRVAKVNFHCFGGKTKLAKKWAEEDGWWFSIPANARVNEAFKKMLRTLPIEKILTETDAPYLAPARGQRNEPHQVVGTIELLAELRDMTPEQAKTQVWQNYLTLFGG